MDRALEREERSLDAALEQLITKVNDVKQSLGNFIVKLESDGHTAGEPINWSSVLESFALLSSQYNAVMKFLKNEQQQLPNFRNKILLPLKLNPDLDEDLAKQTEGRVQAFNHEMVPNYLRTKLEPELERNEMSIQSKASNNPETQFKNMQHTNKLVSSIVDNINGWRNKCGTEETTMRERQQMTSSNEDTRTIIAAVTLGKFGLRTDIRQEVPTGPPTPMPPQTKGGGKAPPAIKTNIKTNIHPYQRN